MSRDIVSAEAVVVREMKAVRIWVVFMFVGFGSGVFEEGWVGLLGYLLGLVKCDCGIWVRYSREGWFWAKSMDNDWFCLGGC